MKTCTKCGQEKPLDGYHRNKDRRDGRVGYCKDCVSTQKAEYHQTNRGKILAQKAEYRQSNWEKISAGKADYCAANPHTGWASDYRRRARQYGFPVVAEPFTREDVIERYGDACIDCGGEWVELDHVIPVSAGGPHTLDNVNPVCRVDNMRRFKAHRKATAA